MSEKVALLAGLAEKSEYHDLGPDSHDNFIPNCFIIKIDLICYFDTTKLNCFHLDFLKSGSLLLSTQIAYKNGHFPYLLSLSVYIGFTCDHI